MGAPPRVRLDYGEVGEHDELLISLSAVSEANGFLWTASDEGRTLECLEPDGAHGYSLKKQHRLDDVFPLPPLPNEREPGKSKRPEADIESISVCGGFLWICGSHRDVRVKPNGKAASPSGKLDQQPSRCLLGRIKLADDGGDLEPKVDQLPFEGPGSLRDLLMRSDHLKPFLGIPSKENGLDIEGISATESGAVFLGLRGPVIGGRAVILEAKVGEIFTPHVSLATHFFDLDGLGVRDLTHHGANILILAGPVGGLDGPFRIYRWRPGSTGLVETAEPLYQWPIKVNGRTAWSECRRVVMQGEHPEGFCWFRRHRHRGLLVFYDNPDEHHRIKRHRRYLADWIPHSK